MELHQLNVNLNVDKDNTIGIINAVIIIINAELWVNFHVFASLSPRTTKLWRGYRVCPIRMYVSTYVRTFVRMFTFCHRSSDLIYHSISI